MRTILFIIEKEFKQIFRDKMMLPIIFAIPVIQLLILSYTATFEVKNINLGILNIDQSQQSSELINKFKGSTFFNLKAYSTNIKDLEVMLKREKISQIIYIPNNFGKNLSSGNSSEIQIITDAVNGSSANLMSYYAISIIMSYNSNIIAKINPNIANYGINSSYQYWYNQELDYKRYMVPGILVLLVTMIGAFLSGMNIVREKEIGTIEQINVTPIKKYEFIIGKLSPFWIIAMFDLIVGLLLSRFVFNIEIQGNIFLIFSVSAIYLLSVLGLGLLISTVSDTQQQAMFIAWFFMVVFIMLSGLFTPVESIPQWAKIINYINPIKYFIKFMRQVMLKGSNIFDVYNEIVVIVVYSIATLSLAFWRYRKVS